ALKLCHRRLGSAGRAVLAQPLVLVAPEGERREDGAEVPAPGAPPDKTKQPGVYGRKGVFFTEEPGGDAVLASGLARKLRVEGRALRLEPLDRGPREVPDELRDQASDRLPVERGGVALKKRHARTVVARVAVPGWNARPVVAGSLEGAFDFAADFSDR